MKHITFLGDYTPEESSSILRTFDDYLQKTNDISISYIYLNRAFTTTIDTWLEMITSQEVDIVRNERALFQFADEKYFEDLSEIVDEKKIIPSQKKFCLKGRRILFLPDSLDGLVLFYNKQILKESGVKEDFDTWDSFINALQKIKKSSKNIIPFALHNLKTLKGWWAYYLFQPFLAQGGFNYSQENLSKQLESKEAEKAFKFLGELVKDKLLGVLDEKKYQSRSSVAFAKGDAAFMLEGPWAISSITEYNPKLLENIGVTILKDAKKSTLVGGRYFAIPKSSNNKQAAKNFLKIMMEKDGYFDNISTAGKIPGYSAQKPLLPIPKEIFRLFSLYGELEVIKMEYQTMMDEIGNKIGERLRTYLS